MHSFGNVWLADLEKSHLSGLGTPPEKVVCLIRKKKHCYMYFLLP